MSDLNTGNINVNLGDTVPDIIDKTTSAFPRTTKAIDEAFSTTINTFNLALTPVNWLKLHANYALSKTQKLLKHKLKNTPPEKIITPPPHISVPTLQAISYSADCEELHNMFASLLASAMNADTVLNVHPAFINTIGQLSPFEAKILSGNDFKNKEIFPSCNIRLQENYQEHPLRKEFSFSNEGTDIYQNIVLFEGALSGPEIDITTLVTAVENLMRLRIIRVSGDMLITDSSFYDLLLQSLSVLKLEMEQHYKSISKDRCIVLLPSYASLTTFGGQFIQTCVY